MPCRADVAELVDAHGSGPCGGDPVEVQVLSSALVDHRDELPGGSGLGQARSSVWIGRAHDASRSLGLRLRFMGALLLLILPLGAAAWAFGNYAATNERLRTEARLDPSLRAAVSEYGRIVDHAQLDAIQLATRPQVQRALRDRDHAALARLRRRHPDLQFLVGKRREPRSKGSVQRSIAVVSGNRVVGSIVADVTLDRPTLADIARNAGLAGAQEIPAAVRGNRVLAASIPVSPAQTEIGMTPNTVAVGRAKYIAIA